MGVWCVVPAAVPHLFTALRVAFGVSWATLVAAELIAARRFRAWHGKCFGSVGG